MLTPAAVQAILKTLPIGYYLGAKINLELDEEGEDAYYDPMNNRIVIGYKGLPVLDKLDSNDPEAEDNLRCLLYHELSHALLTPIKMKPTDVLNVFEDERIESVFSCFYHRVNFKNFIKKFNGWTPGKTPKSAFELFYDIVRFDEGPEDLIDEKKAIILKHAKINRASDWDEFEPYIEDVNEFYKKVKERFGKMDHEESPDDRSEDSSDEDTTKSKCPGEHSTGDGVGTKTGNSKTTKEKAAGEADEKSESTSGHSEGKTDSMPYTGGSAKTSDDKADETEGESIFEGLSEKEKEELLEEIKASLKEGVFDKYKNVEFENKLAQIIMNAARKKRFMGSSTTAYSGKLNPKILAKPGRVEDYKWWTKPSIHGDHKNYDKLHINLFIDISGSFYSSENKINELIRALIQIERSHPDFDFDVIKMGDKNLLAERSDRGIKCYGGNYLTNEIIDLYKKVQQPTASNYNIVVFDGDAQSFDYEDNSEALRKKNKDAFRAWNHSNCVIISDPSNQHYFEGKVPNAKEIYTRSYTRELEANIVKALQLLFR